MKMYRNCSSSQNRITENSWGYEDTQKKDNNRRDTNNIAKKRQEQSEAATEKQRKELGNDRTKSKLEQCNIFSEYN